MIMKHETSESDITSIISPSSISSSSSSPAAYYVQSPSSRDSHDDKYCSSSSNCRSPNYDAARDSYSNYPSMASSSSSRISGKYQRRYLSKQYYCDTVVEEKDEDEQYYYGDKPYFMQCRCFVFILIFGLIFGAFCFIVWGASRPFNTQITLQSLTVDNIYYGEGLDRTGVPTKMITVNCSVSMVIHNPATFFGIHVSSQTVSLFYSQIVVATGQLRRYYQPRKSTKSMSVRLIGEAIPLYGTGMSLVASDETIIGIPFKLEFEIKSKGYLVGKLVKRKHTTHISCSLFINSKHTKTITFHKNSCNYI